MLVHRKELTRGKFIDLDKNRRQVVPVRFVRACRAGHIGDIDWHAFVHGNQTECRRRLWIDERGTSGDLSVLVPANVPTVPLAITMTSRPVSE